MRSVVISRGERVRNDWLARAFVIAMFVAGCQRPERDVIENAARVFGSSTQADVDVPVGVLFNRNDGAICFVLGELNEVHFSDAVPIPLRAEIERRIARTAYDYEGMKAQVFDERGREVSSLSLHRRHPRLSVWSLGARASRDACFAPADKVHLHRWRDTFGLTYPVGENADD